MGHHGGVRSRVVTWNLQGRERPDLDAVEEVLRGVSADVVLLQEVQRRDLRELRQRLGWAGRWTFKHWPVLAASEGLAVLSPHPMGQVSRVVLAERYRFWSWRRRVAMVVDVRGVRAVNTHLGAGVGDAERTRQAALTIEMGGAMVAGDLNTSPGSSVLATYAAAGYADAWGLVHPDDHGATNWAPGPRDQPPTQRIDYVLVGGDLRVVGAELPADPVPLGALSDHLPLVVDVEAP
jgi:endonuclease/exonuclease/phosphatase family metal-dependent hydrolase